MSSTQIVAEHIVNIDTAAQHIDSIDAVALMASQIAALAGMLPDVAATVQMRATLLAVAKKLTEIKAVSDALPLMAALEPLVPQVSVIIGMRPELAAVTGQMDAIRRLSAALDTLLLAPDYAAQAAAAAERALTAVSAAEVEAESAEKSRLGAEFAEDEAKAARDIAVTAKGASETARDDARKAAEAAAAVSGLPDASAASPGDPLIWNGSKFAVGTLDETLQSAEGTLGLAAPVLNAITTAQATADSATATAEQAATDAAVAKTTAEGVDAKATQALADAAEAKTTAESAGTLAGSFDGRLAAAENETLNVGTALSAHSGTSGIHTPKADIVAIAEAAATRLKDGGDGSTLPADRATLLALSGLIDEVGGSLADFLGGAEPGKRMAILNELERLSAELSGISAGVLTRGDVVNALDSDAQDAPLAAAQGPVLVEEIEGVRGLAIAATRPWVSVVKTLPETWPDYAQPGGLLLCYTVADGKAVNPEWYANDSNVPVRLVTDASGIRLADGTTVQSGVAATLAAAQAAQTAATAAQTAATEAKTDAASAKTTAEGVDAKATQAQTNAAEAKTEAASAKTTAEGIDAKATQAQTEAAAAKTTAEGVDAKATQALEKAAEALASSPDLATQTTPGIVKGSDTVGIGEDGSVNVLKGGAVVISPPTLIVPPTVAVGLPFDIGLTAGPVLLPGATVVSFEVTVDGGAPVSVPAVDGAATLSHTTQGEVGTKLSVSAIAVDSMENQSKSNEVESLRNTALVQCPTLRAPSGDIIKQNVTFVTSAYATSGMHSSSDDLHAASQYRLRTLENSTVYDSGETTDLLTHVAADPPLSLGASYLADARHKSALLGWSEWSKPQNIVIHSSRHGERIDNKATLIGNPDGTPFTINGKKIWVAVIDAQYRPTGNRVWGPSVKPAAIASLEVPIPPLPFITVSMTEQDIDTLFINEINSSKHNTDALAGLSDNVTVCRQNTINGIACDMPSIKVLSRVWQQRAFIDSHDPSVLSNQSRSLGTWQFNTNYPSLWASSSQNIVYRGNYLPSSAIKRDGLYDPQPAYENGFGVLPVLEIDF